MVSFVCYCIKIFDKKIFCFSKSFTYIAICSIRIILTSTNSKFRSYQTIFVGQYPVDEWHERLGGGTQADSIMDHIIHNAYEIPTSETNLRKIYDTKKLKRLIDEIES